MIPREVLFKLPSCMSIKVSPDGLRLAFVGSDEKGGVNLFVSSTLSLKNARALTSFKEPEIRGFYWTEDSKKIIFLKDQKGNRQFHLFCVDVDSGRIHHFTEKMEGINAKVYALSKNSALVGINARDPHFHDIYRVDFDRNQMDLIYINQRFIHFLVSPELEVKIKIQMNPDSSLSIFDKEERELFQLNPEDAFNTEFLRCETRFLYLLDSRNANTTHLKKIDLETLEETGLGQDDQSDIQEVFFHSSSPVAYATYYVKKTWHLLSEQFRADFHFLKEKIGEEFEFLSLSADQTKWILKTTPPEKGLCFWLYDRQKRKLDSLFADPHFSSYLEMRPHIIASRDGKSLVSYLTLPKEAKGPIPLIVVPHGGPFKVRDFYAFSPFHQWLASRGYAVLSVNFRLSSGFGKQFVTDGNGEWGGKAHEDVLDAISYFIEKGVAHKDKIGVFGISYGGYEALASLTFSPKTFACAVAICGPSNLKTVLQKVPFYWEIPSSPLSEKMHLFTKNAFVVSMGGDPDKKEEVPFLESRSPLNHVDKIEKPLLLVHGVNDPIVASSESDQIFLKMKEKHRPVLYLSFPDEGHGILKFANSMCYLAYSEWLLSKFLGGVFEPLSKEELKASSATLHSHILNPSEIINE